MRRFGAVNSGSPASARQAAGISARKLQDFPVRTPNQAQTGETVSGMCGKRVCRRREARSLYREMLCVRRQWRVQAVTKKRHVREARMFPERKPVSREMSQKGGMYPPEREEGCLPVTWAWAGTQEKTLHTVTWLLNDFRFSLFGRYSNQLSAVTAACKSLCGRVKVLSSVRDLRSDSAERHTGPVRQLLTERQEPEGRWKPECLIVLICGMMYQAVFSVAGSYREGLTAHPAQCIA